MYYFLLAHGMHVHTMYIYVVYYIYINHQKPLWVLRKPPLAWGLGPGQGAQSVF